MLSSCYGLYGEISINETDKNAVKSKTSKVHCDEAENARRNTEYKAICDAESRRACS